MNKELEKLEYGCGSGSASKSEKYNLLKAVRVELNRTMTSVAATS